MSIGEEQVEVGHTFCTVQTSIGTMQRNKKLKNSGINLKSMLKQEIILVLLQPQTRTCKVDFHLTFINTVISIYLIFC